MSPKKTIFLSFLAGALGSLLVNLFMRYEPEASFQKGLRAQSPATYQYTPPAAAPNPAKTEPKASIASTEKPAASEKEDEEDSAEKIFSNASSAAIPVYAGGISPYSTIKKNLNALHTRNAEYLKLFPKAFLENVSTENFGFEKGLVGDVAQFLKKKMCVEPKFYMISEADRNQSKFFEAVKENTYRGQASITGDKTTLKFDSLFQFDSPLYENMDFLEIKDAKNIMEKRLISPDVSGAVWRFNTCASSVVLLSDRCAWNSQYSLEFKDFFVAPDSKKLMANVYCRKTKDTKWTPMGTLDMGETAE